MSQRQRSLRPLQSVGQGVWAAALPRLHRRVLPGSKELPEQLIATLCRIKKEIQVTMGNASAPLIAVAGLLGAAGVALAAAAAHVDGSEALRAAAELAMVHAVAGLAIIAISLHARRPWLWRTIVGIMLTGAILFVGTVGLGVLAEFRPLPMLAPVGGSLTILAWVGVSIAGLIEWMNSSRREPDED